MIEWTKDHQLGHLAIDSEHQRLVEAIDRLTWLMRHNQPDYRQPDGQISEAINELFDVWRLHRRTEEHLMRETGYPGIARHVGEHNDLTETLAVILLEKARSGALPHEIGTDLAVWFLHHLRTEDAPLVMWLSGEAHRQAA